MGRPLDIIFIAGSWPPRRGPRAVQNARLLASLPWQGHLFVRCAAEEDVDNSCREPVLPGMQEHRLWSRSLTPIHRVMQRVGLYTDRMPDDALPWALRTSLSTVFVGHSDLLVTISHPLSTHIAGLITKRFHRKLPWLTYFSDPWSDWGDVEFTKHSPSSQRINRWLERQVIQQADGLAFPSPELAAHFQETHPAMADKLVGVIPQSFDPELYPRRTRKYRPDELLIRSLGDFYGPRSPLPLLEGLAIFEERCPTLFQTLKIELYGQFQCDDKELCLERMQSLPVVTHHGHVSYERSLELMVESDALLNLGVKTDRKYFRPSKLIHYLAPDAPWWGSLRQGLRLTLSSSQGDSWQVPGIRGASPRCCKPFAKRTPPGRLSRTVRRPVSERPLLRRQPPRNSLSLPTMLLNVYIPAMVASGATAARDPRSLRMRTRIVRGQNPNGTGQVVWRSLVRRAEHAAVRTIAGSEH